MSPVMKPDAEGAGSQKDRRRSIAGKPNPNGVRKPSRPKKKSASSRSQSPDANRPIWQTKLPSKDDRVRPTYTGWVRGTIDALILVELCLRGELCHVARRPHDDERGDIISSGSVFVYESASCGITRWTDTKDWSPSRIHGNFLLYRELIEPEPDTNKKKALGKKDGSPAAPRTHAQLKESYATLGMDLEDLGIDDEVAASYERMICGSLLESYKFKVGGLLKKTISVLNQGIKHHVVSYYTAQDVISGKLGRPIIEYDGLLPRESLFKERDFNGPLEEDDLKLLRAVDGSRWVDHRSYRDTAMSVNRDKKDPVLPGVEVANVPMLGGSVPGFPPGMGPMIPHHPGQMVVGQLPVGMPIDPQTAAMLANMQPTAQPPPGHMLIPHDIYGNGFPNQQPHHGSFSPGQNFAAAIHGFGEDLGFGPRQDHAQNYDSQPPIHHGGSHGFPQPEMQPALPNGLPAMQSFQSNSSLDPEPADSGNIDLTSLNSGLPQAFPQGQDHQPAYAPQPQPHMQPMNLDRQTHQQDNTFDHSLWETYIAQSMGVPPGEFSEDFNNSMNGA